MKRILIVALMLSGCMTPGKDFTESSPSEIAEASQVISDPRFDKGLALAGPDSEAAGGVWYSLRGAATKNRTEHFIRVGTKLTEWAYLRSIDVEGGQTTNFKEIRSEVTFCDEFGCTMIEEAMATLPDGYLKSRASSGFQVRIQSREREPIIFRVPANYVRGYLSAFESNLD